MTKQKIIQKIKGKRGYQVYTIVPRHYLVSSGYEIEEIDTKPGTKFLLFLDGTLYSSNGVFYGEDILPNDYEHFASIAFFHGNLCGEPLGKEEK